MHKLLLALFIFLSVVLIIPQSEVLAVCNFCAPGTTPTSGGSCSTPDPGSPGGIKLSLRTLGCNAPDVPSTTDPNDASCVCGPPTAPGAPAAGAPTTPLITCTICPPDYSISSLGSLAGKCVHVTGRVAPVEPTCSPTEGGGKPCSDGTTSGIRTAIGCIPTEPKSLVEAVLKFATLGAGGIAFLLMILGALGLITAEGNPENVKKAQERFYSAIIGLLFIIFSVLIMQLIGVDILGLPGFGKRF